MKSALWLWQIYHIRCCTLTRSDQTWSDQAKPSQARRGATKCWDCRANLGNMVKFQLGVSKAFTAVGRRTYVVWHTISRSVHLSVLSERPQVRPDLLVGSSWRWGVKFFTANCVIKTLRRKLRAEFSRSTRRPMLRCRIWWTNQKINF